MPFMSALQGNDRLIVLSGCVDLIGFFLLYLLYVIFRKREHPTQPNLVRKNLGRMFLLAISAQIYTGIFLGLVHHFFPVAYQDYESSIQSVHCDKLPFLVELVVIVVIAPLFEEMCFRVFCFDLLRDGWSVWVSACISGVCFGVFHGNAVQGVYAFLCGVLIGYIYEYNGGWLGSYSFHLFYNFNNYLIVYLVKIPYGKIVYVILGIVSMFMLPVILGYLIKNDKKKMRDE